ncbi:MAG: hypothetical protein HY762_03380 [Planctomycetes bacterium]|nr:hypothetical protein [Planctomycetota bacterium]
MTYRRRYFEPFTGTTIAPNAITSDKIADETIESRDIKNQQVKTEDIADKAVTLAKLGDDVPAVGIPDNSISAAKLADNAVEKRHIKTAAVDTDEIAPAAVTTDKLRDANVTPAKLSEMEDRFTINQNLLLFSNLSNASVPNTEIDVSGYVSPDTRYVICVMTHAGASTILYGYKAQFYTKPTVDPMPLYRLDTAVKDFTNY